MKYAQQIREIADAMLQAPHDAPTARAAAELFKLASETEKSDAEARKLAADEAKTRHDLENARRNRSADDRKAYLTLLAPVFTTLILALTLLFQYFQFSRSERDKADEAQRQAEAREDADWKDAVSLLATSEKISPAGVLLKKFASSPRYHDEARRTALQVLLNTGDPEKFEQLFNSIFEPPRWENLPAVLDLDRAVSANYSKALSTVWNPQTNTAELEKLTGEDKAKYEFANREIPFLTSNVTRTLKGDPAQSKTVDLHATQLYRGDFRDIHLEHANVQDASLQFMDCQDAHLEGITGFQNSLWTGSNWWTAAATSSELLDYLQKNAPFKEGDPYVRTTSSAEYEAGVARLKAQAKP
jgi:hypothetical protein